MRYHLQQDYILKDYFFVGISIASLKGGIHNENQHIFR